VAWGIGDTGAIGSVEYTGVQVVCQSGLVAADFAAIDNPILDALIGEQASGTQGAASQLVLARASGITAYALPIVSGSVPTGSELSLFHFDLCAPPTPPFVNPVVQAISASGLQAWASTDIGFVPFTLGKLPPVDCNVQALETCPSSE
jgi:hypothetical protein